MIDEIVIGSNTICAGQGDYRKMYFLGKKDNFGFVESLTKDELEHVLKMLNERECEEKREKKYEYAAKYNDGFVSESHFKTANGTGYAHGCTDFASVVRREVGEWEEVKNA